MPHVELAVKLAVALVGGPIVTEDVLVFVTVMVCCVAAVPVSLLKTSAVGSSAMPGSAVPKPASVAVTVPASVTTVRTPLRGP